MDFQDKIRKAVKNEDYAFLQQHLPKSKPSTQMIAVSTAITHGKFELIKTFLLDYKLVVKTSRTKIHFNRVLEFVREYDRPDVLDVLLNNGFSDQGSQLLKFAVESRNFKTFLYLIKKEKDLDQLSVTHAFPNFLHYFNRAHKDEVVSLFPLLDQFSEKLNTSYFNHMLDNTLKNNPEYIILYRHYKIKQIIPEDHIKSVRTKI